MDTTRQVRLSAGTLDVTDTGGDGPPLVFLHGLLVGGSLWREVVARVRPWARCIVPELPLGSHRRPMNPDADLAPPAIADLVAELLGELGVERATIVGNDSGGALSQLLAARHPERVERLVLTPCDAFEQFPPKPFDQLPKLGRFPRLIAALLQPTRIGALHNTPLAYGLLARRPIPRELTEAWLAPARSDAAIRRDLAKVLRGVAPGQLLDAAERLRTFDRPVLVAWAADDRVFKRELGERLAQVFPQGRLELIDDTAAFVPLDRPDRLAELLGSFVREPAAA